MVLPHPSRTVRSIDDLLRMMDELFVAQSDRWTKTNGSNWWDDFYSDRSRPIPFFAVKPDENLVEIVESGLVPRGRALDLGAGPGRNALYLDAQGFEVDAIDLSPKAVEWGAERARDRNASVTFICGDAFDRDVLSGSYDFVYDSGCFHHLPPHRRVSYLALLDRVLRPGGYFGLACFARGQMGSELPDAELYTSGAFEAGVAYSADDLRWVFQDFEPVMIRPMREEEAESTAFGRSFLLTALFRRG